MLLSHGWLATLSKPATISEDDEEELERDMGGLDLGSSGTDDKEVAEWVVNALERKRNGTMRRSWNAIWEDWIWAVVGRMIKSCRLFIGGLVVHSMF